MWLDMTDIMIHAQVTKYLKAHSSIYLPEQDACSGHTYYKIKERMIKYTNCGK
jgi:hypothetical protein